jgi:hypothetical protein
MRADYRVFIDACVIANFGVCDLLLRLAERPRLIVPHWSAAVLDEVKRTQSEKLGWPADLVTSFQQEIRRAFPEAEVEGYEGLIATMSNEPKDRHVLAAAIRGGCPLILTFNLKHFPPESLAPWSVQARNPQDYLLVLYEMEPKQVIACLGEIAGRRKLEIQDILIRLGRVLPCFSSRLLDDLDG